MTYYEIIHLVGYLGFVPAVAVIIVYVLVKLIKRQAPSFKVVFGICAIVPILLAGILTYMSTNYPERIHKEYFFDNAVFYSIQKDYKSLTGRELLPKSLMPTEEIVIPDEEKAEDISEGMMPEDISMVDVNQKGLIKVFDIFVINFFVLMAVGLFVGVFKYFL